MSSAFERSLRGASTTSSSFSSSSHKPAKKKSVRWNDGDALSAGGAGESGGVLRSSSSACANATGGALGAIHEAQSINHLRVPAKPSASSTRVMDSTAHHHGSGSGGGGGLLASGRKRPGGGGGGGGEQRGIQMGAVRVRTPAKPKRARSELASYNAPGGGGGGGGGAVGGAAVGIGTGATHNFLRRGTGTACAASAAVASPKRSPPGAAGAAATRRPRSPLNPAGSASGGGGGSRLSPSLHRSRSPRATPPRSPFAAARFTATPMASGARSGQRQRRLSSSQALRNVAGGDDDDDAEATFLEDDDGEGSDFLGASGASDRAEEAEQEQEHQQHDEFKAMSSADGPSPMSALSTTLSSIGLAAGGGISGGKPPRSPRAGRGSPGSEFFGGGGGGGGERGSSRASPRSSPKVAGVRTGTPALEITDGGVEGLADGMVEEAGEDEEEFLALGSDGVARQSLDSRLAAAAYASSGRAAAAARASVDNLHNNNNNNGSSSTTTTSSSNHTSKNASPSSLSPFTKNTTVRRTSTSTVHVNGEPTSVVSEEMSEEVSSFTVTSAACGCQHELGCSIGAFGGQLPAGENGTSIEVSDRLKELQGRTSMLEQEKVNLTLALAPLEERLQAKERAWNSERRELMVRSEANLRSTRVAEDRCRELERRKSEMEEERHSLEAELRRLRGEIEQRESKTAESFWQRTVAADREKTRLENALDQAEARVVTLNKEKCELEAGLLPIQSENSSLKFRLIESEKVASRVLTAEEGLRFSETQLEVLKSELAATSAQLTAVQTELAHQKAGARKQLEEKERKAGDDMFNLRKEMQRLQETICSQADRVVAASMSEQVAPPTGGDSNGGGGGVEAMVVAQAPTESVASVADAALSSEAARIRQQELTSLRSQLEASLERTQLLEKQVEEGEEERRRMHNTILDLAGSVRVYVRARPFLKSDGEGAAEEGATVVRCGADASSIAVLPPDAPNRGISCAFDHVFGGHASQEDVFKEVSGFVQSALDGYKVCLFSYGQTGSGKTHTMTGSGNGMMRGIVPRAVEHILARVGELQDGPWKYNVQASFLEIYNEELRDLLVGHGSTSAGTASTGKLSIKKSAGGGTEVAGLTKYDIDTGDRNQGLLELDEIMRAAQRTRSVACTAMNAESSRSHSVFTLWLTGVDASTGTTLRGVLHLVDLAGSERLDRSGVGNDAQRLRETQAINKSLSCLADVFSALAAKASHVPYRNSKLTYLMQDCLSGDGKALMFVNLSPTAASANETVCSLRFANQVNQVQLGKATRQLSLSKPAGSSSSSSSSRVSSGGARGPNSPPRTQGSRLTRASGSAASTAPPSPRSSQGGSFGFGRTSAGGGGKASAAAANNAGGRTSTAGAVRRASRLSSSSSTASPPPTAGVKPRMGVRGSKRTSLTGSGGPGGASARARGTSAASRGGIGGGGGAPTGGGVGARAGGRTSVSGSRLPRLSAGRSRGSGEGLRGGEEGGRRTSGSTRPSSAISKSLPPSPKPTAAEKRLRLSSENKRQA